MKFNHFIISQQRGGVRFPKFGKIQSNRGGAGGMRGGPGTWYTTLTPPALSLADTGAGAGLGASVSSHSSMVEGSSAGLWLGRARLLVASRV